MSIFNKIKHKTFGECIDIIEWTDNTSDTIVWRFPRYNAEIKNSAQLTVRKDQIAVLVNEGRFADIYQPGRYELTAANMPVLTTFKDRKYGFNSSFKVDIYFVNTKQFLDLRWGTSTPVIIHDPEFGPIRMRAFGSYCFRIEQDPTKFIRNVAGTDGNFTTGRISRQLRNFVVTKFTDYLGESKIAPHDLAANLNEFSEWLTFSMKDDFSKLGIELTKFLVENISFPEEVQQALNRRTSMSIVGEVTTYTQMQFADSLKYAANNPAGGSYLTGDATGAGIGLAMAGQMVSPPAPQTQNMNTHKQAAGIPPPPPQPTRFHVAIGGIQQGPFPVAQLHKMIQQRQVSSNTLVWTAGMPEWAEAGSITSLIQLFGAVPPPL